MQLLYYNQHLREIKWNNERAEDRVDQEPEIKPTADQYALNPAGAKKQQQQAKTYSREASGLNWPAEAAHCQPTAIHTEIQGIGRDAHIFQLWLQSAWRNSKCSVFSPASCLPTVLLTNFINFFRNGRLPDSTCKFGLICGSNLR